MTESGGRLLVADTATGEVVAEHAPVAPGEASVLDEHYGGPRPAPRRAVRPKTAAEKAFFALGPVAGAFLAGSAASGNTRLAADLDELAALRAAHGDQALIAALERAVAFRRWRAEDVRSILAAGAGTAAAPPGRGRPGHRAAQGPGPAAVGLQDRGRVMTAAAPRAGRRPGRRAAPAQARRDAPPGPRADGHREDPAVVTGGVPAHPAGRRDDRPGMSPTPAPG